MSSSLSSPAISPRNISPVNPTENSPNIGERFESSSSRNHHILIRFRSVTDLSSMLSDLTVPDRRAPGCEKKSLEMAVQQNLVPFDYEQKKLLATKAIQTKPATNDYRVPTSAWSGYGLSQTIPPISATDLNKVKGSYPAILFLKFNIMRKCFENVGIDHLSSIRFVEGTNSVGI